MKILHLLIVLSAFALSACQKPTPSRKDLENQLKLSLPPWLEVRVEKQEVIEPLENELLISFDAQISPKEDLYLADWESVAKTESELSALTISNEATATDDAVFLALELGKISLVKLAVPAGQKTKIYGKIGAVRDGNKFNFSPAQLENNALVLVAKPRSSFPDSIVANTPEHKAAIKQVTEKVNARQVDLTKHKEARKQTIISAFAVGRKYVGTWKDKGTGVATGQLALTIVGSDGKSFQAVLFDPEKPKLQKPVRGILIFDSETHQAKLAGVNGEGNPHVKIGPEGIGILEAMQRTAATTNYRFLEVNSTVDFELQIQNSSLKGNGRSGRGSLTELTLNLEGD